MVMKSSQSMRGSAKPKTIYEFVKSRQDENEMRSALVSSENKNSKRKIIENTLKCVCAAETVLQLLLLAEKQKKKKYTNRNMFCSCFLYRIFAHRA